VKEEIKRMIETERQREGEKKVKRSYFVFARRHVRSERLAPLRLPSRERAPCSSRSAICHLVVYFRCPDAPFSLSRHLRNTKADLSEFYVSKRVIVLATRLRRLLHCFHIDSASSACLSIIEVSRERVYLTCQKFPCILVRLFVKFPMHEDRRWKYA